MSRDSLNDIPGLRNFQSYVPSVAAATASIKYPFFRAPQALKVTKIEIVPQDAVTGADTHYRELNFLDGGADGTGTTEVGNIDLVSGTNLVALDGKDITLAASVEMAEGDTLILSSVKAGNGILVPALLVYVEYTIT